MTMHKIKEHGFWDYICPGTGGMEKYGMDDFKLLLDDMAGAGMNSLNISVKWQTTGYRSKLKCNDYNPESPVAASGNQLLRDVIAEARRRRIKVWINACGNIFPCSKIRTKPIMQMDSVFGINLPFMAGLYDADSPEIQENAIAVFKEIATEFPGIAGMVVEIEFCDQELPSRIPLYDKWAKRNGRPPFEKICHPLNPRLLDISPWRDYTTAARVSLLKKIEKEVRSTGYKGNFAMICETGRMPYLIAQNVNLEYFKKERPDWKAVTYEYSYNKTVHRFGMMELAIEEPKKAGLEVYYLPRGVMTYAFPEKWPFSISLGTFWDYEMEDIAKFRPEGVWWFGSGCSCDGAHVHLDRLRQSGFKDGVAARRKLLKKLKTLKA